MAMANVKAHIGHLHTRSGRGLGGSSGCCSYWRRVQAFSAFRDRFGSALQPFADRFPPRTVPIGRPLMLGVVITCRESLELMKIDIG